MAEDEFDIERLKVPADRKIKVKPILNDIPVGKPSRKSFFRVRSGAGWEPLELYVYAPEGSKTDTTPYLVYPECQGLLEEMGVLVPARFYFYILYGSNIVKVDWVPVREDKNGSINRFHLTRMEAYEAAKTHWIRLQANTDAGFYTWALAEDILPDPEWSEVPKTLSEAVKIAFKGHTIRDFDHPEMKKLRGKLI